MYSPQAGKGKEKDKNLTLHEVSLVADVCAAEALA